MNRDADVLWLSVSPYLKCFDRRLLSHLARVTRVQHWEYRQTADEPCFADAVVMALHEWMSDRAARVSGAEQLPAPSSKVHLLGHGVSGAIGLLYARRYPQHVASLTLLSVGAMPAVNWQAHYYALRNLLPCSREMLLAQMIRLLFGPQAPQFTKALSLLLAKDLDSNLTLHSLAHHADISPGGIEAPLLVCEGENDAIVFSQRQQRWQDWFKPGDTLWTCPSGNHFFHFHHCALVAKAIADYWQQLAPALRPASFRPIHRPHL